MSDLPAVRVEACPKFAYCAVDLFKPGFMEEGCIDLKIYCVMFIWKASKAH